MRVWKKISRTNGNDKKVVIAIPILDKTAFKIKAITKDKEDYYIIIKGSKKRILHSLTYTHSYRST